MRSFAELERGRATDGENLDLPPPPARAPSLLLYTSGTTGLPKAVVSPYGQQRVKSLGLLANLLYGKDDRLYTCLPLFHANALMLTVMQALWLGLPLTLSKRFSASRFWQELSACGATQLNTVGGMIPILLKTPPSPYDRAHKVKRIVSAACPKDAWEPFERRFGIEIWEAYGAVDGAGVTIFNAGDAPVGSLGKPGRLVRWKLVDADGRVAAPGEAGELLVFVGDKSESKVPYWKNEEASREKVMDGWLHTGDVMQADAKGYLYFVGRSTDSMRRRGENVSAYEVEKIVDAYPDVLESAAFGVPSPVGEQDIMISVVPVEGRAIAPEDLVRFLRERLPRYAVPSYLDVVGDLPKTGTHRVVKADLKKRGVTASTIRLDEVGAR
jgi:crotonobetaine/carnitine-CoA ligase